MRRSTVVQSLPPQLGFPGRSYRSSARHLSTAHFRFRFRSTLFHFRFRFRNFLAGNNLHDEDSEERRKHKRLSAGPIVIKLFMAVIYECL